MWIGPTNTLTGLPPMPPPHLTVSELSRAVAQVLQNSFSVFWVAGELSSITKAASGHWYFTLSDSSSRVRCVMYRQRASAIGFVPMEGDTVMARVLVSFYEPRGEFQLLVENLRPGGQGQLYEAFVRLKMRLQQEGLLDAGRKRRLPLYACTVGIVTSPQAAALGDVIRVFRRRAPHVRLILYPTLVQGLGAPAQIAQAIQSADRHQRGDVLLVVRGGGSAEDLTAFNHEAVARAIAAAHVPVVTGIGHESDTTIADLTADVFAATPTAAAEMISAGFVALREQLKQIENLLALHMQRIFSLAGQRLDNAAWRLKAPLRSYGLAQRQLPLLAQRMLFAFQRRLKQAEQDVAQFKRRQTKAPSGSFQSLEYVLLRHLEKMQRAVRRGLQNRQGDLRSQNGLLQALSPQRILARGYALVDDGQGRSVTSVCGLAIDRRLVLNFHDGGVNVVVVGGPQHNRDVDQQTG
ncbi:MAG: exodeoxyribonuclease VII large subunit [Burkholderiaceae bacterium]|jgi:exodeoxyribonuclease VII large subunit